MSSIWWSDIFDQWGRAVREWHPQRAAEGWIDLRDRLRLLQGQHQDDDLALLLALAASFAAQAQLPLEVERLRRQVQDLEALAEAAGDDGHQAMAAELLDRLPAQPQP